MITRFARFGLLLSLRSLGFMWLVAKLSLVFAALGATITGGLWLIGLSAGYLATTFGVLPAGLNPGDQMLLGSIVVMAGYFLAGVLGSFGPLRSAVSDAWEESAR